MMDTTEGVRTPGIVILTECQISRIMDESILGGMVELIRRINIELEKNNCQKKYSRREIEELLLRALKKPQEAMP